ncbi:MULTISPECIES: hypothetical protein [unclassified Enterobacter]|nr:MULTISPECIES: hypothetical protein [unclassified Enterobacter]MBA7771119.1 hypothetical protein [Enterobacter sp. RHBSTW-00974]MBA7828872.1 hypothetical protein [Enterobacter sp. RHBSTW-00340]MBA8036669.1 hypothetical protein [Enterobacter sp. RHBSTW-00131]
MNNNSAKYIISQIENVITNIFENGKINKDTQDELFHAMTMLADVNAILRGLEDAFFDSIITAKKLEAISQAFCEGYFTNEDNERIETYLAAMIHDYSLKCCQELKDIEAKLGS